MHTRKQENMEWMIDMDWKKWPDPVSYRDRILLMGSCFTEHIGNALGNLKFRVLQNPNGILFGPDAVCKSLLAYTRNLPFTKDDLFFLNETWNSWSHHSRYSAPDTTTTLEKINASQEEAHRFLKAADWVVITLGSSFTYRLTPEADLAGAGIDERVANCHRAPANWFVKELMEIDAIKDMLEDCLHQLLVFNPALRFIFTISPVRHIRDGVVENNRSKARLLESVHYITTRFAQAHYFPAYELVIDVLRDYRFYDIDLVHPNYPATEFVLEQFIRHCLDEEARQLVPEIKKLVTARKHKAFHPTSRAHQQFLSSQLEKANRLAKDHPFLDLHTEIDYFSKSINIAPAP